MMLLPSFSLFHSHICQAQQQLHTSCNSHNDLNEQNCNVPAIKQLMLMFVGDIILPLFLPLHSTKHILTLAKLCSETFDDYYWASVIM